MMKWYFILLAVLTLEAAGGGTLYVPADYGTIQEAINAANHYDVILVAPGVYLENIAYGAKIITVRGVSADGEPCVIDGSRAAPCVTMFGTTADAALEGFTITNGIGHGGAAASIKEGCGIYAWGDGFTVRNCRFTGNYHEGHVNELFGLSVYGYVYDHWVIEGCAFENEENYLPGDRASIVYIDGMYATSYSGDSVFKNNIVRDNRFNVDAGVSLFSGGAVVLIENNVFTGNRSKYGSPLYLRLGCAQLMNQYGIVRNNIFADNVADGAMHWFFVARGGGLFVTVDWQSRAVILNNTVYGNYATYSGSGLQCSYAFGGDVQIYNNIFWANKTSPLDGDRSEINLSYVYAGQAEIDHNMIEGGKGAIVSIGKGETTIGTTFCANPLFVDAGNLDFHLLSASPCIDIGFMDALCMPKLDYDGQPRVMGPFGPPAVIDIGADEFGYMEKTH